eukprot:365380-Chlamydomonas_euryale.AAC.11
MPSAEFMGLAWRCGGQVRAVYCCRALTEGSGEDVDVHKGILQLVSRQHMAGHVEIPRAPHTTLRPHSCTPHTPLQLISLRQESRFVFLNTLFSVSEAVMYMQVWATRHASALARVSRFAAPPNYHINPPHRHPSTPSPAFNRIDSFRTA